MSDISKKNTKIIYPKWREIIGYYYLYTQYYHQKPATIPINSQNHITMDRYNEMLQRTIRYVQKNHTVPRYITIPSPKHKQN